MAQNTSRSMSADLTEGATDGKYFKTRPNTGGPAYREGTDANRADLAPAKGYGNIVSEDESRVRPA